MRDLPPPFRFDIGKLVQTGRRLVEHRVTGVSINLPFVSFSVSPDDVERGVAREVVIRLADRRVLNAFECCDNCIDQALSSLQEIRRLLVDKQVELAGHSDCGLYLLLELQNEAIRQFLSFEQSLRSESAGATSTIPHHPDFYRVPETKQSYFAALEMLRGHLYRCLEQVAKVADIEIPKISQHMRYDEAWQLSAYVEPALDTRDEV